MEFCVLLWCRLLICHVLTATHHMWSKTFTLTLTHLVHPLPGHFMRNIYVVLPLTGHFIRHPSLVLPLPSPFLRHPSLQSPSCWRRNCRPHVYAESVFWGLPSGATVQVLALSWGDWEFEHWYSRPGPRVQDSTILLNLWVGRMVPVSPPSFSMMLASTGVY